MGKGFYALGHCSRCGDTIGPWSLIGNEWLCDMCAEKQELANESELKADEAESEQVNVLGADAIQDMIEQGLLDLEEDKDEQRRS